MTEKKPAFARPIGWYRMTTKQRLLWAEQYMRRILKADDERRTSQLPRDGSSR